MIYRRGSEPPSKSLLLQEYGLHLTLLLEQGRTESGADEQV